VKNYSLQRRIAVSLTITTLIAGLCTYGWLYLKTRSTEIWLRGETLLDRAQNIAGYIVVNTNGAFELNLPPRLSDVYINPKSSYRYAVRDESGQLVFTSALRVRPLSPIKSPEGELYDYDPDGAGPLHMFGAAVQTIVGGKTLLTQVEQLGTDSQYLSQSVFDEFVTDGIWLQIPFLLLVLSIAIWAVRRAIAPLTNVSRLAESIGPASASIRLPTADVPQEVLPLVRGMNAALDRLDTGLRLQREFNANAAHQLRTPLAVLLANIDVLDDATIANRLRPDVELMSRIVSQLLIVARLETLSIDLDEVVELNGATADIAANLAPLAIASSKSIELVHADQPIYLRSSNFALRAALGNLIENAINHTPAGTSVCLRVTNSPSIEVIDSGPGIVAEQRARIFERFWRADQSKNGAGLGLAIVAQVMKALNGSVSVANLPGGGAQFALNFPPDCVVHVST
jgi:signal transduction histidine kinase